MNKLLQRQAGSLFGSCMLLGHLLRGAVGIALLAWAILHQSQPLLSVPAGIAALIAFRGCPMCWAIGLVETVMQKFKPS